MPTPKKKFLSQTRSSKTKATHPDPVSVEHAKPGLGKKPLKFKSRLPTTSWWLAAAAVDQRDQFIVLAHQRNLEMLESSSAWKEPAKLHQLTETP